MTKKTDLATTGSHGLGNLNVCSPQLVAIEPPTNNKFDGNADSSVHEATGQIVSWLNENLFDFSMQDLGSSELISSHTETAAAVVDSFPLTIEVSHDFVEVILYVPGHVPDCYRDDAVSYLSHVNWVMKFGVFVLDVNDGGVELRYTLTSSAALNEVSHAMGSVMNSATQNLQTYVPGLIELSLGLSPHIFAQTEGAEHSNVQAKDHVMAGTAKTTIAKSRPGGHCTVKLASNYTLDGLNIVDGDTPETVIKAAKSFLSEPDHGIGGCHVLLTGPSGTGKTQFAHYVADTLGLELYTVTAAEILGCYVGETEKAIARIFAEASERRCVLFIDEADSILQSRATAGHQWEITQINQILVELEAHDGIVIVASNFAERLDSAASRRFVLKVHFDFLDNSGKQALFRTFFGGELTAEERTRLNAIDNLTPGDFRVVAQRLRFTNPKATNVDRLAGLERESASKGIKKICKIGF